MCYNISYIDIEVNNQYINYLYCIHKTKSRCLNIKAVGYRKIQGVAVRLLAGVFSCFMAFAGLADSTKVFTVIVAMYVPIVATFFMQNDAERINLLVVIVHIFGLAVFFGSLICALISYSDINEFLIQFGISPPELDKLCAIFTAAASAIYITIFVLPAFVSKESHK
jgi:uncharacterized membrane protein